MERERLSGLLWLLLLCYCSVHFFLQTRATWTICIFIRILQREVISFCSDHLCYTGRIVLFIYSSSTRGVLTMCQAVLIVLLAFPAALPGCSGISLRVRRPRQAYTVRNQLFFGMPSSDFLLPAMVWQRLYQSNREGSSCFMRHEAQIKSLRYVVMIVAMMMRKWDHNLPWFGEVTLCFLQHTSCTVSKSKGK